MMPMVLHIAVPDRCAKMSLMQVEEYPGMTLQARSSEEHITNHVGNKHILIEQYNYRYRSQNHSSKEHQLGAQSLTHRAGHSEGSSGLLACLAACLPTLLTFITIG